MNLRTVRAYLFGLVTTGFIATQLLDLNSTAYFVTVWASIGLGAVAVLIRKAGK